MFFCVYTDNMNDTIRKAKKVPLTSATAINILGTFARDLRKSLGLGEDSHFLSHAHRSFESKNTMQSNTFR